MSKKIVRILLIIILTIVISINFVYAENNVSTNETTTNTEVTNVSNTTNTTTTDTPKTNTETTNTVNTNTSDNNTNKTTNTNTNTNKTATATQTTAKSSNANLANLGINPNDFSGFKESKTSYSVSVPNNVQSVEVYAKTKDSKAKVTGTGNLELKEGQNTANVVVTAEDGTTKTYTITITRLKVGEKVEKVKSNDNVSLSKIEIEGMNLEPAFETEKYEYTVEFEGEQTSLDIKAEANNASNIVQIIGNNDLIDGENHITIMVSNSSEDKTVLYKITVNKNLEKIKAQEKEEQDRQNFENIKKWGLRLLPIVVVLLIIMIIIIKHRKSQYVYEDDEEDYHDEYEEELPKSLRRQRNVELPKSFGNKRKEDKKEIKKKSKRNKGKHSK